MAVPARFAARLHHALGADAAPAPHVRVLDGRQRTTMRDLWDYRDLLYFLAWRDVKVRYTQSVIGVGWAVGQPLLMMAVFAVFLGAVAKLPGPEGVPYPVFVLAGLVPWTFFSNAVSSASGSLVGSANLVEKVYFPRLVVPLAALLAWLPDVAIATALLVAVMGVHGIAPGATVLLLPAFVVLAAVTATSVGIWVAALNVAYRDVKYAIPFVMQLLLFATPVVYDAGLVPDAVEPFYGLNPLVGVVEGFRWSLLGGDPPAGPAFAASLAAVAALLVAGLAYFRRVERYFADVI